MGTPSGNEPPTRLDGSYPASWAGHMRHAIEAERPMPMKLPANIATEAGRDAAESYIGRPEPQPMMSGLEDQGADNSAWADAVHAYNRERTAAYSEFRMAADVAWQTYHRAMAAANAAYDDAVIMAASNYDRAMITRG